MGWGGSSAWEPQGWAVDLMGTACSGSSASTRDSLGSASLELDLALVREMQCSKTPHYSVPSSLTDVRKWPSPGRKMCCSSPVLTHQALGVTFVVLCV